MMGMVEVRMQGGFVPTAGPFDMEPLQGRSSERPGRRSSGYPIQKELALSTKETNGCQMTTTLSV